MDRRVIKGHEETLELEGTLEQMVQLGFKARAGIKESLVQLVHPVRLGPPDHKGNEENKDLGEQLVLLVLEPF
jgi:hypothetical protein